MKKWIVPLSFLLVSILSHVFVKAQAKTFRLMRQTRDPKTNQVIVQQETVATEQLAIIIIDPWNYHWCMTWTEQVGGMATRLNRALECARRLGIQVIWAPTDVASMYSGWPQRQMALSVPYLEVPRLRNYSCQFTIPIGKCLCGPGIDCKVNYGWDGIDPRLNIAKEDLIVSGTKELYSVCKFNGITHLLYFGGATNICLTGKPEGISYMYGGGLETIFARDMAFAWSSYDPSKGYTPSMGNEQAADDLERAGIPTTFFVDELRRQKVWKESWITDEVRITPAGTSNRPYFFDTTVTVTLETPFLKGATIYYTLDGSVPTTSSHRYQGPLSFLKSERLRTATYKAGRKVSPDGNGIFILLPALPPQPDITIASIPLVEDLYAAIGPVYAACLWQPVANKSYEQKPLRIREQQFTNGLGMRAPAYRRMDLKPEWKRFVALAGVDDNMLDSNLGRNIAMYPKVIFKIFIDGNMLAESPVMRISQAPWRFNVVIPPGSRQLVLVCDDAGDKNPYNLGDIVNAGFCLN